MDLGYSIKSFTQRQVSIELLGVYLLDSSGFELSLKLLFGLNCGILGSMILNLHEALCILLSDIQGELFHVYIKQFNRQLTCLFDS